MAEIILTLTLATDDRSPLINGPRPVYATALVWRTGQPSAELRVTFDSARLAEPDGLPWILEAPDGSRLYETFDESATAFVAAVQAEVSRRGAAGEQNGARPRDQGTHTGSSGGRPQPLARG